MKPSTLRYGTALVAALGILLLALQTPRSRPATPREATTRFAPTAGAPTALDLANAGPRRHPVAPALRSVLPQLAAPVDDWRQFTPQQITICPYPGMPITFAATSIRADGKRTTWVGTNPEQGVTLVACGTDTLWNALLLIPGADEIAIQVTPETVMVEEHPSTATICGETVTSAAQAAELLAATGTATLSAAEDDTVYYSDVLVLYDSATGTSIGTAEQIENAIATMVAAINVYLDDSLVTNLQWRLVGVEEAPSYTTTSTIEDDIDELADPTSTLGRFARTERTTYGADQVILMITGTRDYAGIAYTPGYLSVALYNQGARVAAHELAHNFGCLHDRETAEAADSDGHYYYAHRFVYQSVYDVGTIMSYADYYIPYFSNPDVSYNGYVTGVAAGEAKAADNARWLRENASMIANLVASKIVDAPTITTQPSSVTVTAGASFSLSVTASGDSLTYQWYKGTNALSGATAATYTKTTSVTTDTGTYYVVVANSGGSVQSNSVTVTVNASTTTTTTTSSSSSSGGGGGGAFGLWAVVGLAALRLLRSRLDR